MGIFSQSAQIDLSAEAPPAPEAATITAEAPTAEISTTPARKISSRVPGILPRMEQFRRVDRSLTALQRSVQQRHMIQSFSKVAKDHTLTAPLVDAFRATPGFAEAVQSFPQSSLFDTVPQHSTSANNVAGLESLSSSEIQATDLVQTNAVNVAGSFRNLLGSVAPTLEVLQEQVGGDRLALESSDLTSEVMTGLPVTSINAEQFTELLTKLEDNLRAIAPFDTSNERAYPEHIKNEVLGMQKMAQELGPVIGLTTDEDYGLVDCDRAQTYEPTQGTFGDKAIDLPTVNLWLSKAESLIDAMQSLSEKREDLSTALENEAKNLPAALESDDTVYGQSEHLTLMSGYTALVSKLMRESMSAVAMVLSVTDAALNVDAGVA